MTMTTTSLFRKGALSVGLVLPVRSDDQAEIDSLQQLEFAMTAEELGFAAVWVRDVPLNGPWYPERFGHPDPVAMLAAIAARTSRIAIGSAAIVLPLRHPLHIAKSAVSLDRLSRGRFVLGLGSGDRPEEFVAFGETRNDHKALYRDHWARLAAALERPPRILLPASEQDVGFELRPMAQNDIPMLAVGSGGQSLEWIARNAIGWATYHRTRSVQRDRHALWDGLLLGHCAQGSKRSTCSREGRSHLR
jgi:luciferase-type oxidoreductase